MEEFPGISSPKAMSDTSTSPAAPVTIVLWAVKRVTHSEFSGSGNRSSSPCSAHVTPRSRWSSYPEHGNAAFIPPRLAGPE